MAETNAHGVGPEPAAGRCDRPATDTTALSARLERRVAELTILREIGDALHSSTDLDRIVYTVLVGATAHQGLRYHRAFLLLADRAAGRLRGRAAVGPSDAATAASVWAALGSDDATLVELLHRLRDAPAPADAEVRRIVEAIDVPLDGGHVLAEILRDGRTVVVERGRRRADGGEIDPALLRHLGTDDFVAAPMVLDGRPVGLLLADDAFVPHPFGDPEVQLLEMLAGQAAMALHRATLIEELRDRTRALEDADRELRTHHRRLLESERMAALGQMAARVAHEFRTPLAVIGGFARAMLDRRADDDDTDTLRIIADEVRRLETIVTSVLTHAREPRPVPTPVAAEWVARKALDVLRDELERARVDAEIVVEPNTPPAFADRDQSFQAVVNLVRNAIEAMPDGGTLRIVTRAADDAVELEIADDGVGMAAEVLDRVRDPFFTTRPNGTGLGLSIVASIARAHGGSLDIRSRVGEGTRVILRLPGCPPETGTGVARDETE